MTLENAIKTLDDVIPPHTHNTVDREHMPIVLAWEAVKVELENLLCPISGGGHDFVEIEPVYDYQPDGEVLIGHRCQCKRCLKKKFVLA